MKLAFFNDYQLGLVKDDFIINLMSVVSNINAPTSQDLINGVISEFNTRYRSLFLNAFISESEEKIPLSQVELRAPLPRPGKIVAMAANYMENGALKEPKPINAFFKSPESVIGNGDTVILPPNKATIFHHEAEFGLVIGETAKDVRPEEAYKHIFGYINFIDVSARGLHAPSFFWGKSWDTFGPMGPFIVTADEIPDPQNINVNLWINGDIRQTYNTNDMGHKIPRIIEWASSITRLEAGDIVICGTNHQGLGALQDGDKLEMEADGLGRLSVSVRDDLKREWPRGVDKEIADRVAGR
jgi:2-keto-4-pentenoate hydratase/2-oxohepta-3-ene-1,7-dioic acid hydratase in catechol pathway